MLSVKVTPKTRNKACTRMITLYVPINITSNMKAKIDMVTRKDEHIHHQRELQYDSPSN